MLMLIARSKEMPAAFSLRAPQFLSKHQPNYFPDGSSKPPTTKDRYNLSGFLELELQDFD